MKKTVLNPQKRKVVTRLLVVADGLVTICVLYLALYLIGSMGADPGYSRYHAAGLFFAAAISKAIQTILNRNRARIDFLCHLIGSLALLVCSVLFLVFGSTEAILVISGYVFIFTIIAGRVIAIIKKPTIHTILVNVILSLIVGAFLFVCNNPKFFHFLLIMMVVTAACHILVISFSRIKLKVLMKIVRKTFAAEVLFGMILLIVAVSLVLPTIDAGIANFEDALWYCFSIVTTIGFGDLSCVSVLGRVLSVILGLYGIITVAVITSVVVNFYNEVKSVPDDEDEENLSKEEKTLPEKDAPDPSEDNSGQE